MVSSHSAETWSYKFVGRTVEQFIRILIGQGELDSYPEFRDRRNRAEALMSELTGQEPCLFHLSRLGVGRELDEQRWELVIATDSVDFTLPSLLTETNKTLKIVATIKPDSERVLRLISVALRPLHEGYSTRFSTTQKLRLVSSHRSGIEVPYAAIQRMFSLPERESCIPTQKQLEAWKAYITVEEKIALSQQFAVPFVSHNYGQAKRNISFAIDAASATIDGNSENIIQAEDFWKRVQKVKNSTINIADNRRDQDSREIGTIENIDIERNLLKVRLNSETYDALTIGDYKLPEGGNLAFKPRGTIAEIKRKKTAIADLERGRAQNPYLGQFLFDASQARDPGHTISLEQSALLLQNTNSSQKVAVEIALSAPDLALIQGPPGTGKTTVIAEICYQVAIRGGRTLITSQANLAVDNALSRLHQNPAIRAVRKGNRDSVGPEGEPFLEERVVQTWLSSTSADCNQRLNNQRQQAKILSSLMSSVEQFRQYLGAEEKFKTELENLKKIEKLLTQQTSLEEQEVEQYLSNLKGLIASSDLKYKNLSEWSTIEYEFISRTIDQCLQEIKRWRNSVQGHIHIVLRECVNSHQRLAEDAISLPVRLNTISSGSSNLPWQQQLSNIISNTNRLIERDCRRGEAYVIACEIREKVETLFQKQNLETPDSKILLMAESRLEIYGDSVETSQELKRIVYSSLTEVNRTIGLFTKIVARLQDIGFNLGLCRPSKRSNALAMLKKAKELSVKISRKLDFDVEDSVNSIAQEFITGIEESSSQWLNDLKSIFRKLETTQADLKANNQKLKQAHESIEKERIWWSSFLQSLPPEEGIKPVENIFDLKFICNFQAQFSTWQQRLKETSQFLSRYEKILAEWVTRLQKPSEQDHYELRQIYLNNTNVIGITCSQSAKRDFSEEFKFFDVVIIDEVSKCTPPEILIPALKAKKLILVGDHKQLPPMLNHETVEEIAQELGTDQQELAFLRKALFKSLFESASSKIKKMLTTQYRMHPSIMGAINQFYDNQLECGLANPNEERNHNLSLPIIPNDNHLIWISTPNNSEYREHKIGTSYINEKEIDVIERLCQQLEKAWLIQRQSGELRKEVGIITFYGSQLRLIEERIDPNLFPSLHIRTGTVDRFQGMERQIVIVSMVRNNNRSDLGFAKKPERVNVAFSRAQELLVIVGSNAFFTQQTIYANVSKVVSFSGGSINVSDIL